MTCTRCNGTRRVGYRGEHPCPGCTHVIEEFSRAHGHFAVCSCGWRHFETKRQNALGRASKMRGAVAKHLKEVGKQ